MNAIKKYVASRTLTKSDLTWNNTSLLSPEDTVADIPKLRGREGGDLLVWGSASLVKALLVQDLVDELSLMIEPILLDGGKRIFPEDGAARPMQLVKHATAGTDATAGTGVEIVPPGAVARDVGLQTSTIALAFQ